MAFCLKRREPVAKAVRRLGRKRMEKALASLEHCDEVTAVHSVRKDIKQTRGLLRLVRPQLDKEEYSRHIKLLRKAARRLDEVPAVFEFLSFFAQDPLKARTAHGSPDALGSFGAGNGEP